LVGSRARELAGAAALKSLLDSRYDLSVREYEEAERERTCYIDCGDFEPSTNGFGDWYKRHYVGSGKLVFRGIGDHYRRYAWS
jgi:3-hydroxy-3-methylglutaryl CoA synthase